MMNLISLTGDIKNFLRDERSMAVCRSFFKTHETGGFFVDVADDFLKRFSLLKEMIHV